MEPPTKSKRASENQITKDDNFDDDEVTSGPVVGFQKASDEVIATRKIVKVKRKVVPSDESNNPSLPSMPKSSNPFAFLSNTSLLPNNNTQGLCFGASAVFAQMPKSNEVVFTNNAPIPTNNSQKDSTTKHSEYHTQIEKLNRSFLQWMEKQILNHPFGIWKDGVQDYIIHAKKIAENFDVEFNSNEIIESSKANEVKAVGIINQAPSSTSTSITSATPLFPIPKSTASADFVKPFDFNIKSTSALNSVEVKPPPDVSKAVRFGDINPLPFQFPSNGTISTSGTVPFSFGTTNATAVNSIPTFSFPTVTALPGNTDEQGDDDGEEGEPRLEPEIALRNANDRDEVLFEGNSKLMKFDKSSGEWKDMGKGNFRVSLNMDTNKPKMTIRNLTGKIMFNAGFYKEMKFEKVKGGSKFSAFVSNDESNSNPELNLFIIKVKDSESHKMHDTLVSCLSKL